MRRRRRGRPSRAVFHPVSKVANQFASKELISVCLTKRPRLLRANKGTGKYAKCTGSGSADSERERGFFLEGKNQHIVHECTHTHTLSLSLTHTHIHRHTRTHTHTHTHTRLTKLAKGVASFAVRKSMDSQHHLSV